LIRGRINGDVAGALQRGQSLIELALLLPLILFLLLGLTDVARAVFYYNVISNAAREGGREAVLAYNQCSNRVLGTTDNAATCPAPPSPPSSATLVGVQQAIKNGAGGIMSFDYTNAGINTDTGTPTSCTPTPNSGCVYVFLSGTGSSCTDASGKPDSGPGPTDRYSLCDFNQAKTGGGHNAVVEINYQFLPFTPLVKDFLTVSYWAKSEMRTEY